MYFMYLDKSYWIFMYWKQHTMIQSFWWVTLYFPVSFYSDTLKKLIVHLYHLLLETQDIILKKYMGRNCLYKKFCFSYNLLLQERVFDKIYSCVDNLWWFISSQVIRKTSIWFWHSNSFVKFKILIAQCFYSSVSCL